MTFSGCRVLEVYLEVQIEDVKISRGIGAVRINQ